MANLDFSSIESFSIPEGEVYSLSIDGVTVWEKNIGPDEDEQLIPYFEKTIVDMSLSTATSIKPYAFYQYSTLETITAPEVKSVGDYCFYKCTKLNSIEFNEDMTSIGNSAFEGCTALTSIDIQGECDIGENAFYGCSALTDITLGEVTINNKAFYNVKAQIDLSNIKGLKSSSVDGDNFRNNTSLTEVDLSNIEEWDAKYAFHGCSNLTKVIIGEKLLTAVPDYSFYNLSQLTEIWIYGDRVLPLAHKSRSLGSSVTSIYVPANMVDSYKSNTNYSNYTSKIQAMPNE